MRTLLLYVGIALLLIGLGLILFSILSKEQKAEVRGGGVIIIGPFPIIFGTDHQMLVVAAVMGIVLLILGIILFLGLR